MNATIGRLHFTRREQGDILTRVVLDCGANLVFTIPRDAALMASGELASELRKDAPSGDGTWWCDVCKLPMRRDGDGPMICPECKKEAQS